MQFPFKKISASLVSSYYDCPLQFKLINIDGLIPKLSDALDIGNMFDLAVKSFHSKLEYEYLLETKFSKLEKYRRHTKLLKELMDSYTISPYNFTHPKFDVRFNLTLRDPLTGESIPYPVVGFLDGLDTKDGTAEIVEYKTTSENYTQEKIDNSIQGTIYGYYLFSEFGIEEPIINYVVINKKTKEVQFMKTTRKEENFMDLFSTVKQFIKDIEEEKFNKNINHPFWCQCEKL